MIHSLNANQSTPLMPLPTQQAQMPIELNNPRDRDPAKVREAFDDFVGQTFFLQLLSEMRKSVAKPAYLHGGQTEEVFQGQLDQVLAEKLSDATASQFSGPMFELFMLPR